ncbi:MAG: MFS transporter [Eggerthellaceae bacterium]|nr:MFS transporter [Eggerthellaceae bacterium]
MADPASAKKAKRQAIMTAVGCIVVLSCIGGGATIPNIVFPSVCAELNVTVVEIGWYVLISTAAAFISGLVGVKLFNFLTPRWTMLAGVITVALCMIIAGTAQSLPMFVFSGVFSGFACACTFPPIASLMQLHFKENSGKLFGLTTGAQVFVVAGMIKIIGTVLQTRDYRFVMLSAAVIIIVIGSLFTFLLIRQPRRKEWLAHVKEVDAQKTQAEDQSAASTTQETFDDEINSGLTVKEATRKPALYLFCLGMFAGAMITGAMSSFGSSFFVLFGMTQAEAADMMSLYTLLCGVHVLWTGFFHTKFGSRVFVLVQYVAIVIGVILLMMWANSQSAFLVFAGLFFVAFIKPINSTPAFLVPDLFGRKHYLEFNSLSTGVYYAGICVNSQSTSIIMTVLGGVQVLIYLGVIAVVAAVSFLFALALSPMKKLRKARE